MSAYYDIYETPVPEGEEPKSLHDRVCSKGTISGKEFMERGFREEHMPHAMVVGIVQAITTTLGDWLAKGYTVGRCFCLFKTGSMAKAVFSAH